MKSYDKLGELEKIGIEELFKKLGFNFTTYHNADGTSEKGMANSLGVGFQLKDIIVDGY